MSEVFCRNERSVQERNNPLYNYEYTSNINSNNNNEDSRQRIREEIKWDVQKNRNSF